MFLNRAAWCFHLILLCCSQVKCSKFVKFHINLQSLKPELHVHVYNSWPTYDTLYWMHLSGNYTVSAEVFHVSLKFCSVMMKWYALRLVESNIQYMWTQHHNLLSSVLVCTICKQYSSYVWIYNVSLVSHNVNSICTGYIYHNDIHMSLCYKHHSW